MTKVLLISDPESILLRKTQLASSSSIKIIGEATSYKDAVSLAKTLYPDLLLIDLNAPKLDMLEASHKIIKHHPKIKIMVLMSVQEQTLSSYFIKAGAQGYAAKDVSTNELVSAIHKVQAGQLYLAPEIAHTVALRQIAEAAKATFRHLSQRELQVMILLAQGMRALKIADKLGLSYKTVNTYRYRMFAKLNIKNDVQLTYYAARHGLLGTETLL